MFNHVLFDIFIGQKLSSLSCDFHIHLHSQYVSPPDWPWIIPTTMITTNTGTQSSNYDILELEAKHCLSYQYKFDFSNMSRKRLSLLTIALANTTTSPLQEKIFKTTKVSMPTIKHWLDLSTNCFLSRHSEKLFLEKVRYHLEALEI